MNHPIVGWALVLALFVAGWQAYGWKGVIAAFTATVFWLLLQFNRTLRVMKIAGNAPVGHIDSAVMLNARLKAGMTMLQVVALTKSLGQKIDEKPGAGGDSWAWADNGDSRVLLHFAGGKLQRYELQRPSEVQEGEASPAP